MSCNTESALRKIKSSRAQYLMMRAKFACARSKSMIGVKGAADLLANRIPLTIRCSPLGACWS